MFLNPEVILDSQETDTQICVLQLLTTSLCRLGFMLLTGSTKTFLRIPSEKVAKAAEAMELIRGQISTSKSSQNEKSVELVRVNSISTGLPSVPGIVFYRMWPEEKSTNRSRPSLN